MQTCVGFGRFEPDHSIANFLIQFVEIEVDTETGSLKLLRVLSATDVGQIIDPPSLEGQLNGVLGSAGIDTAVFEESILDRISGHILNTNMIDYKWRTFLELPEMVMAIQETALPTHRFKAVGVGEIAPAPGPSAVLMAVSNAVGTRIWDYPLIPEKILSALGRIKEDESK